jgi:hypothetical protein
MRWQISTPVPFCARRIVICFCTPTSASTGAVAVKVPSLQVNLNREIVGRIRRYTVLWSNPDARTATSHKHRLTAMTHLIVEILEEVLAAIKAETDHAGPHIGSHDQLDFAVCDWPAVGPAFVIGTFNMCRHLAPSVLAIAMGAMARPKSDRRALRQVARIALAVFDR